MIGAGGHRDYSATPLVRKLGVVTAKGGAGDVAMVGEPAGFRELLGELPGSVRLHDRVRTETRLALCFVRSRAELEAMMDLLAAQLPRSAHVWCCIPRRNASRILIRTMCAMRGWRGGWWITKFALSMRTGRG
jgi:hypothetical protein